MQLQCAALLLFFAFYSPCSGEDRFYPFAIDQDRLSGIADYSYLNHPLLPADRLFAKNGHFYSVGKDLKPNTADDQRVRLFGVNLAFGANFPEKQDARRIAKRLRRLGVNLVRLHHMDSSPDRDPKNARSILTTDPYPTLNPISVERLRFFLDALKAEGIYANLNLHVGYEFRPSVDKVPPVEGADRLPKQSKPLHVFYPRMVALQVEFTHKVIEALKLKDDPVLGMIEIDNEASLLFSLQANQFDRLITGEYKAELDRQKQAYLQGRPDSADETIQFVAERDRAYLDKMLAAVREKTDAFVPVTGTQVQFGGLLNYDTHASLDYRDNHFYIDHYNFPHVNWDTRDWRFRDASSSGTGFSTYLNQAATREAGRPFTVSEFNQPFPNTHAAELDPTLAAFGAFQDWDSIVHFAYEHGREWESNGPSGFNINGDWTKWVNIGQSAWIFRSGAVQTAKQSVNIPLPFEMRLQATREKQNGNMTRFLKSAAGYDANAAFVHRVAVDPRAKGPMPEAAKSVNAPYQSDTGELTFDPERKVYLISAAQAAGVFGFAGAKKVTAGSIDVELTPATRGFAAVLLTSMDHKPIATSQKLLLTIPGYTLREQPGSNPPRPQKIVAYAETKDWFTLEGDPKFPGKPSGMQSGPNGTVWMERVECLVTLRTAAKGLIVYPLDGAGVRKRALGDGDIKKTNGAFVIHLQADGQELAPWYEIVTK